MNSIWHMWSAELNHETVASIIKECEFYKPMDAVVGAGDTDDKVRKSIVRWINPYDVGSEFIHKLLWKYATLANRNAFGVKIDTIQDIQYTIYEGDENGHYNWHFDTFWANQTMNDRKLSITIQLSDSDDYEGGNFILDRQYQQPDSKDLRTKGTILVFPSPIKHKVTPVTKGIRKSLVAWVEGPKWR